MAGCLCAVTVRRAEPCDAALRNTIGTLHSQHDHPYSTYEAQQHDSQQHDRQASDAARGHMRTW
jgi:hypothetical protein